jgi:pyridoxamine 5'-phosphate oxidase-like protein
VPRTLTKAELDELLALDVPARLATLEADGFPRVTPIWFFWENGTFWMTSLPHQPHVRNLERDARAAICVDVEDRRSTAGMRRNQQVKGRGLGLVRVDEEGVWTRRITRKYVVGEEGEDAAARRAAMPRVAIELRPERLFASATD